MATYGNIYQFSFYSQNGSDVDIFIAKKGYSGEVFRRPLGRAPILRRERNDRILGTSLEVYAECRVDGEYAQLYTSSADEFRVEVYRDRLLQWVGYVSPELYSEPDIAPPYDVQIIATDGLGELKNTQFSICGRRNLMSHFRDIFSRTNLELGIDLKSSLSYRDGSGVADPEALLDLMVDLDHMEKLSCYEVLQNILTSFNACATQQEGVWNIIRETDIFDTIATWSVAEFGSANACKWWPIGQLLTGIIPAKKTVTLEHKNYYKDSVLAPLASGVAGGWTLTPGVYYDASAGGYILPPGDGVQNTITFNEHSLKTQVALTIRARAIMPNAEATRVAYMIRCEMQGRIQGVAGTYYLHPSSLTVDASRQKMLWSSTDIYFFHGWDHPEGQPVDPATDDFTIVIPISPAASANQLRITVENIANYGIPDYQLCISDISMVQDPQSAGLRYEAVIGNNAREDADDADIAVESSSDAMLYVTKWGVLSGNGGITSWETPRSQAEDLLAFLAQDYAMQVALPRMRYEGRLNVPALSSAVPMLFERDTTYYFLNTYAFDLLNDELEVELVSIPNAAVSIDSESVTELPSAGSSAGSSSGSSGGGTGGGGGTAIVLDDEMSDTSENGVKNKVIKEYVDNQFDEASKVYDWFEFDEEAQAIRAKFDFYSTGTLTAGGKKEDDNTPQVGLDTEALKDYLTANEYATQTWVASQSYAKASDLNALSKRVDSLQDNGVDLSGYATEQWVTDQGYAKSAAITSLSDRVKVLEDNPIDLTGFVTTATFEESLTAIDTRLKTLEKLLEWFEFDEEAQMIKAKFGLYSVGALTAGKKKEE